jgi:succinyl-CoA synthetase alpha subunit
MNANLVKYGKYGAIALVVGAVAYTLVQKNKKAKAAAALAVVEAAKKAAEAKSAALKAAAEAKLGAKLNYMASKTPVFNPRMATVTEIVDSEF